MASPESAGQDTSPVAFEAGIHLPVVVAAAVHIAAGKVAVTVVATYLQAAVAMVAKAVAIVDCTAVVAVVVVAVVAAVVVVVAAVMNTKVVLDIQTLAAVAAAGVVDLVQIDQAARVSDRVFVGTVT